MRDPLSLILDSAFRTKNNCVKYKQWQKEVFSTFPIPDTGQKYSVGPKKICKDWSYVIHSSTGESTWYLFVLVNNHTGMMAGGCFTEDCQ